MSSQTPTNPEPRPAAINPSATGAADETPIVIPPLIVEANRAFERDLPSMLQTHPGQWVAYRGGERVGFDRDQDALYQDCLKRGFGEEEFIVYSVEPLADPGVISPWSFAEYIGPTKEELTAVLAQARESPEGGLVVPGAPGEAPIVIPLLIVEGQVTFARDLASLLPKHAGQWVAYRGSQRIGFDKDPCVLYRRCLEQGMTDEEFVVRCVEEGADQMVFGTYYFPFGF